MSLAALKISVPEQSAVDVEHSVMTGCRLAEVNRTAAFSIDGKTTEIDITPGVIEALLSLAQTKGRLPAHWTHDRLLDSSEKDYLNHAVGVWRNFRKDDTGNLIGDALLEPSPFRERILWKAVNDPQGIMASLVFDYTGGKENAKPIAIDAGDFVQEGAATTALLSVARIQTAKLMLSPEDKAEIATMISTAVKEAHDAASDTAKIETESDVTEADKMASDDAFPAAMRCALRVARATKRKIAAIKDEAVVAAQAKFAAAIGTHGAGGSLNNGGNKQEDDWDTAITAQITAGAPSKAVAILRIKRDKPALYNKRMAANPNQ